MTVVGLLLAAGAGRRMGTPKALLRDADGTSWLHRSLDALSRGGCERLVVVLGASAEEAAALLSGWEPAPEVVVADDWDEGMGASLRRGLGHLLEDPVGGRSAAAGTTAALVSLVDLPDVGAAVIARVVAAVGNTQDSTVLARASYLGVPGHPVLIGADHWLGVVESARGDRGARDYLTRHVVHLVECGDLATGEDRDSLD